MADKEDTTATLGDSEVLSVQYPPADAIPEFDQRLEDDGKVPPTGAVEQTRDVLKQQPAGTEASSEAYDLEEQPAPRASEASTLTSMGQVLAGESATEQIDGSKLGWIESTNISKVHGFGESGGEHPTRGGVDLRLPDNDCPGPPRRQVEAANPSEQAADSEVHPFITSGMMTTCRLSSSSPTSRTGCIPVGPLVCG